MNNILKKFFTVLIISSLLISCDKMLDADSDRVVFANEFDMKATNDSLYSMFGVFTQLQKVVDNYVLLGELRGDLMDVDSKANLYLKEINNFNISPENPYASNINDYYSVINNCNYVIDRIVEADFENSDKISAACKSIRAWTYMQIAMNYGSVIYYDEPILSVNQAEEIQKRQPIKFEELANKLIIELSPIKDILNPYLTSPINSHNFSNSFFPVQFILGDLYLWTGQYEKAAQEYKTLIDKNSLVIINNRYETNRQVSNNAFTGGVVYNGGGWHSLFNTGSSEYITNIATTNEYGYKFHLDSLIFNGEIISSDVALENWENQMYYYSSTLDTLGDLRRIGSVANRNPTASSTTSTGYLEYFDPNGNKFIAKYPLMNPVPSTGTNLNTSKRIMVYRVALLYLRYAEAVNRAGKPNLAFATLKHGLSAATLSNRKYIPLNEVDSVNVPAYLDFRDRRFDNNIGIRMRGLGNVNIDTTYYIIPSLATLQDSILFVEEKIQEELALETAFEGNRFQDLMRFAIRRNDNAYLADKVAAKHPTGNREAIRTKLMNSENWFVRK